MQRLKAIPLEMSQAAAQVQREQEAKLLAEQLPVRILLTEARGGVGGWVGILKNAKAYCKKVVCLYKYLGVSGEAMVGNIEIKVATALGKNLDDAVSSVTVPGSMYELGLSDVVDQCKVSGVFMNAFGKKLNIYVRAKMSKLTLACAHAGYDRLLDEIDHSLGAFHLWQDSLRHGDPWWREDHMKWNHCFLVSIFDITHLVRSCSPASVATILLSDKGMPWTAELVQKRLLESAFW